MVLKYLAKMLLGLSWKAQDIKLALKKLLEVPKSISVCWLFMLVVAKYFMNKINTFLTNQHVTGLEKFVVFEVSIVFTIRSDW